MKKLLAFLLVLSTTALYAQDNRSVRALEGSFSLGRALTTQNLQHDPLPDRSNCLELELRYNFAQQPIDVGFALHGATLYRKSHKEYQDWDGAYKRKVWDTTAWFAMAVADYNFRQTSKISYFVGLGVGVGSEDALNQPNVDYRFCCMPRCGVEFWQRLRLTLSYTQMNKMHNHLRLSVGISFGGGKKR